MAASTRTAALLLSAAAACRSERALRARQLHTRRSCVEGHVFPPRSHRKLRAASVHLFTLMQLTLLGLCWAINLSPFGLFVSFLIVSLVPARERILPSLFSAAELAVLDHMVVATADVVDAADDHFDAEELQVVDQDWAARGGAAGGRSTRLLAPRLAST